MSFRLKLFATACLLSTSSLYVGAQGEQGIPKPLNLGDAISYALAHYPAVKVAVEKQGAAQAGIGLAKTAYLPSATVLWQGNRATSNNIFGLLLPQVIVPPISGPVLPLTSNQSVWGSAAGILGSWEPFDFGARGEGVNAARLNETATAADTNVAKLNVAAAAADAFFSLVASLQLLKTAEADLNRREIFSKSIHVLVENELRPGAEASRADAELASARIGLIQARTAEKTSRTALAQLLGVPPVDISIEAESLLQLPSAELLPSPNIQQNPIALAENARVRLASSQVDILSRSYYPRFLLQSSISGRGTGTRVDGTATGGASGFSLQRENWAIGLTATFPIFDIFSIRSRKQIAEANQRAEVAQYQQVVVTLTAAEQKAQAQLDGAREIAETTPVELKAARDGETQARARYQADLTDAVEVSTAESLLVRAEIDDSLAKLNVWRSLMAVALAQGDLEPFLKAISASAGER